MFGVPQGDLFPILFELFINSISIVSHYYKLLCFADDMKLFYKIDTLTDWVHLQEDLDRLVKWSFGLPKSLNIGKCKSMHFTRCNSINVFPYSINGTVLDSINNKAWDYRTHSRSFF